MTSNVLWTTACRVSAYRAQYPSAVLVHDSTYSSLTYVDLWPVSANSVLNITLVAIEIRSRIHTVPVHKSVEIPVLNTLPVHQYYQSRTAKELYLPLSY
jgi:hypothetical protein